MRKLFLFAALLISQSALAQQPIVPLELKCPAGTNVLPGHQTLDAATGMFRQNVCVDNNGFITSPVFGSLPLASDAIQYVSVNGNDANVGTGPGNAKATISAALAALPSIGGTIKIGAGSFSFSSTISFTAITMLRGSGASYQNAGAHCITTLTWTGGASIPFSISGAAAQGSELSDFCLNATGVAPPVFIDDDLAAGDVKLKNIIIDTPTSSATVAAIRWGNTGNVVNPDCDNVFVRAAAPVSFDVLDIEAHTAWHNCRSLQATTNDWVFGGTNPDINFSCYGCTAEASSGNIGVLLKFVRNWDWIAPYQECGGTATGYCIETTAGGIATNANIFGAHFSGVYATGATAAIHTNGSPTQLNVYGALLYGTWANPNYCVKDDSQQTLFVTGCSSTSTGGDAVLNKFVAGVTQIGNTAAGFGVAPTFGDSLNSSGMIVSGKCASATSPAACGSSSAGAFTIAAAATTATVNTSAVSATSVIFVEENMSLGATLGVTCNVGTIGKPIISAVSAGVSFTITIPAGLATNPVCMQYTIQ